MKLNKLFYGSFLLCFPLGIYAQRTQVFEQRSQRYQKALELYENSEYAPSLFFFEEAYDQADNHYKEANAAYYIAQSAVRLNKRNADRLMKSFVEDYPTHSKMNSAYLGTGNYYFSIGKYAVARKWYEYVDESRLTPTMQHQYNFNKGYALFKAKLYQESQAYFSRVIDSEKYNEKAMYYLGYISYHANDYKQADDYFEGVNSKQYNKNIHYYRADRSFKQAKYAQAIDIATPQLKTSKSADRSQLHKIIGESHFKLKNYKEAVYHLEHYKGDKGKWSNTDHFYLGFAYYKTGAYAKAVSQFNRVILQDNAVAQNAYYHLADAYLKLGKKTEALNAFKNAHEMKFDKGIRKDAFYNYVKLSYQIGNSFENTSSLLSRYINTYPDSEEVNEIKGYLVKSYFSLENYQEALRVIELSKDYKQTEIYQKILLYRGLELYKDKDYVTAQDLLQKSMDNNINPYLYARAAYWKAEALYQQGQFSKAIENYKKVEVAVKDIEDPELHLKNYQLGYAYFKIKDFPNAVAAFKAFKIGYDKANVKATYFNDALLRLGDSYYVSGSYWQAINLYEQVVKRKAPHSDYALYQKGMSLGFLSRNWKKIETLENLITVYPKSIYLDDAYYEIANTYVAEGNIEKGMTNYQTIQTTIKNSPVVPKAMLKQGLIYYNADQSQKALDVLKELVARYPKSPESLQAVNTVRLVSIDLGKTSEYSKWVNTLDFVEITDEQLDNDTYIAAEQPYLQNDLDKAVSGFKNYISEFPKGFHTLDAHFYLAESYTKLSASDKALPHYLKVAEIDKNQYTETTLFRISEIYLEDKRYEKAIPYLERLLKVADFNENIIFAKSNLMKSYYEKKDYNKTLKFANKVLENKAIDQLVKNDAQLYKARAAQDLGDVSQAKEAYNAVANSAKGELAAEATYFLAEFSHQSGDYEKSKKYIETLAKDYAAYRLYAAKGLVLMARNFYKLDDAYQATYLLKSVIENFKEYPSVIDSAKTLLETIKKEEAKVNSSIENN